MRLGAAALMLLLHACTTSMRADLPGTSGRCLRSALDVLKDMEAEPVARSDREVAAVLKDGRPVRILLEPLDGGTRVQVVVGEGKSPDEIAEAVRILERMADGAER